MSVRMKITRSKTGGRRSHHGTHVSRLSRDTKTGNTHRRHFMDPVSGMYRGRQIIDVAAETAKKAEKAQTREDVAQIAAPDETNPKTS